MKLYDYAGPEIPERKGDSNFKLLIPALAILFVVGVSIFSAGIAYERNRGTIVFHGGPGTVTTVSQYDIPSTSVLVNDGPLYAEFTVAIAAWTKELGEVPIPRPELRHVTKDKCGPYAIACADVEHNVINWIMNPDGDDITVFMHEYAHLLGVPHIDGDALMGPIHDQHLDKPTPLAVAVAKFKIKEKAKQ